MSTDLKISSMTVATTPLAGSEVLPIVQSSANRKVTVSDLTAGRLVSGLGFLEGFTTTATAAGTTTLTVASTQQQYFTGSTTQTVTLPVTSTLTLGQRYAIFNKSSGVVTVQSSGANTVQAMAAGTMLILIVILTSGTGTASWSWVYLPIESDITGTGSIVRATSPTLVTPVLGAATATTIDATGIVKSNQQLRSSSNRQTLSANKTISATDPQYQMLDPNGANRDVTLPTAVTDMYFVVKNIGTGGYTLTVKDSGGSAITGGTIANNVAMGFYYDGTAWQLV